MPPCPISRCSSPYAWETGIAQQFVSAGEVLGLLDGPSYFELLGKPLPENDEGVLAGLQSDQLISRDVGGNWNIHNLGAVLLAKDLNAFPGSLARKAVRLVVYDGDGRMATVTHRKDFTAGYASGFAAFNAHLSALVPAPEDGNNVLRKAHPLFPPVAARELVANALIHQDMTVTGAGPSVEMFRNRLEITNPGTPLVVPERFIDFPPRSRNEALASLTRRMGLCEEQGTGIDKVVSQVEDARLPPPEFRAEANATRVTLFGPRRFAEMTSGERTRACYQHAVLRYLGGDRLTNFSLRERFGVEGRNASQISKVIRQALDAGLISAVAQRSPRAGYVPFWA